MLKPLLKKQFLEMASFFYVGKDGKRRGIGTAIGFCALMIYAFGAVAVMFGFMAKMLCEPLVLGGLDWVYFALIGSISTAFSCVGSVFMAKSKLYEAKDNDLLLAMPVKPWAILFARMVGLYAMAFLFNALVFIPAAVIYFTVAKFSVLSVLFLLLTLFLLPLGGLVISCLLGWLIALLTARIRQKNLITMLFSVAFLVGYFYVYSKATEYLNYVILHGEAVGAKMKTVLFPFWQMGLGATGKPLGFLAFAGVFLALFALTYYLLALTFYKLVTMKRGGKKAKYREKNTRAGSAFSALFRREGMRVFKNPMILFNAALGSVLLLILPVLAIVKADALQQLIALPIGGSGMAETVSLIVAVVVCFMASTNMLTASSISLEGENIALLQSMPLSERQIFAAKLALHMAITAVPAMICSVVLCIVLKIGIWLSLLLCVTVTAFTLVCAAGGLAINLKMPYMHWQSEMVAVKQSMSVMVAMFAAWGMTLLFVGAYFLFGRRMPAAAFLGICLATLCAFATALLWWLDARGARIFRKLH